ncbi:MAG: carboxypeptidase regulatory-like domain-containing protein [Bryobacterales bacterium]|nr:carboxypeptidase regulatory-like domain-containing protein [Bryobacterales bacterium]
MAQTATGTISGYVEDGTGARVPGAKIAILHSATQQGRVVYTNERGDFIAPMLPIGEYEVAAEFKGFKRKSLSGILLRVDQTVTLPIAIEPGNVTETVEVVSTAPLLESETSSLGQVIENKKVLDLPLNGRNVFALGLLAGFAVEVFGMGTNQTFAAGGGRFSGNEILLDGISNGTVMNAGSSGRNSVLYTPSVDALEEFKVKTNSFTAEFGHSAGAVVSATIKAGTNVPHGTLFHFLRNQRLDANNFFSNAAARPKAPYKQNQFGFALGGPVFLPGLYNGRDRTFFFIDYQGTRRRTKASSSIYDLAPMAFRVGDFSTLSQRIYDPASRRLGPAGTVIADPFPGNVIPQIRQNPTSLAIETEIPVPNFGPANSNGRNYFRQPPQRRNDDQFDVRIDRRLSSGNTMFGRFSFGNMVQPNPGSFAGQLSTGNTQLQFSRHFVLNDVHVFSPNLINEFRFGFTRSNGSRIGQGQESAPFARLTGITMFPFPVQSFPSMTFSRTGQISGQILYTGFGGGASNLNFENLFQWVDNLTLIRGNHAIRVGGDVRRHRLDQLSGGFGEYIFGSIFSSSSNDAASGDPWADFLMGFPALRNPGVRMLEWGRLRTLYAGGYVQDDWRITRKLTFNIGLRYELYTQPVDARDRGGLYNLDKQIFVVPGKDGYSRAIVKGDHNNWGPRVGFAYQVTPKFVVRSAYGIFYGMRDQNDQTTNFYGNIPNVATMVNPTITASGTIAPPVTMNSPITLSVIDPLLTEFSAARPAAFTIQTVDFGNVPYPYVQQWNTTLQYELGRAWLFEAAYAGAKGTKLGTRTNLNQVPFDYALTGRNTQAYRLMPKINGTGGVSASDGNNKYHAFNLRAEKRFATGFNFLVNYTVSKNLESNGSGDSSYAQNGNTSLPLYAFDRRRDNGPAPLDIPQRMVASFGYELPWGKGKRWLNFGGPFGKLVSGWQVNGISTVRGGFPTDIRVAVVPPTFATFNVPDRVSGVSMYAANKGVDQYFNPAAFKVPGTVPSVTGAQIQRFGDSARHVGRGPGSVNLDFSLFKNTALTESKSLQFRAEFFNLTNTPTFFLASANSASLAVGQPTFGKLSQGTAVGRQIQFGLKLVF